MLTAEQIAFITSHLEDDPKALALRYKRDDIQLIISQIKGMKTARIKLPHWATFTQIVYPIQLSLEQASSEITAKYKADLLPAKRDTMVDLTGGLGVDFSFLAPHFSKAIYVEQNENLCKLAQHNMPVLGIDNALIINKKSEEYLDEISEVDFIYIDPARRSESGRKVFKIEDCTPNLAELSSVLLTKTRHIVVKYSPMLDISLAMRTLGQVSEVHVVSVDNDCKELLFVLTTENNRPFVQTVNFRTNKLPQIFRFHYEEENKCKSQYISTIKKYLYEPNASILKAGAFASVGERFGLYKLHPNSHLYTSDILANEFPGRIFAVDEFFQPNKENIRRIVAQYPKANISVRNFPMTVAEVRKKTKIKDGGDTYIFATTLADNNKVWIVSKKANV